MPDVICAACKMTGRERAREREKHKAKCTLTQHVMTKGKWEVAEMLFPVLNIQTGKPV